MATSISKRVVFVKTKNKPKHPPPRAAVVQAGSGQMIGGPAKSPTSTFGQAPQPVLANPPFWTLEWWEREWQMVATILGVLVSLGTLIYFVATSDYKSPQSATGTKAPDRLDSPRRSSAYPGSDSGGGSAANRQTPTDESFMASSGARQKGGYDGKPAGSSQSTTGRASSSAAGNERIAPEAGECVLTAKSGAGLAGEIGECLRPGSKK